MRKSIILLGAAAGLAACGQSSDTSEANNAAANSAAAKPEKPAYCFFKDPDTKGWAAKLDKDGNVVVSGKAFRLDPRYKAVLSPATVTGTTAEVSPTIAVNDTGFASPDNWWDVSQTIPNSQVVTAVTVKCGSKTLASLTVPRKK
ncbi:MAG TPA: hypothetical protein VH392_03160 [Sphingomicrobium sp.]|jgi:hypothetical protein